MTYVPLASGYGVVRSIAYYIYLVLFALFVGGYVLSHAFPGHGRIVWIYLVLYVFVAGASILFIERLFHVGVIQVDARGITAGDILRDRYVDWADIVSSEVVHESRVQVRAGVRAQIRRTIVRITNQAGEHIPIVIGQLQSPDMVLQLIEAPPTEREELLASMRTQNHAVGVPTRAGLGIRIITFLVVSTWMLIPW